MKVPSFGPLSALATRLLRPIVPVLGSLCALAPQVGIRLLAPPTLEVPIVQESQSELMQDMPAGALEKPQRKAQAPVGLNHHSFCSCFFVCPHSNLAS